jgi:uncharacterized protein YndB with AHSA1/START domain
MASRVVAASPSVVFSALVDRDALTAWLPPAGMTGRFEHFDMRPGGSYRMVLTYDHGLQRGKAGDGSDVVTVHVVEIEKGAEIVQQVNFDSDDPAYAGTMIMTWSVGVVAGGTLVEIRADEVPDGIDAADHAVGMQASLSNLDAYLAGRSR